MKLSRCIGAAMPTAAAAIAVMVSPAHAAGNLKAVEHIIVIMQENHSFDNYYGVLPYAPGSPYRAGPCQSNDHSCVDGLSCSDDGSGDLSCINSNLDDDGSTVYAFHSQNYCPGPDLDHGWVGSHREANLMNPAQSLLLSLNDGFVIVNDETSQPDTTETPTDDDTMGYYDQDDLPFYYALAQTFAIDDRYFSSVIGPTFPNRAYELAGTSFGHVVTGTEIYPPGFLMTGSSDGYKVITGTIFDLLDEADVTWYNYFQDLPTSAIFQGTSTAFLAAHARPVAGLSPFGGESFLEAAANGTLPPVAFVDPSFAPDQVINGAVYETDEHPPWNIRAGQYVNSLIINAVRNGPNWKDSVIFLTYDEHGGFYDHVPPPAARQGGALNPDGISPGQCADASDPPDSEEPGGGQQCAQSAAAAAGICPEFTATGDYPSSCANFDQLGFRVPFVVISPFAKPSYVSHTIGDHASILAFIERRFLANGNGNAKGLAVGGHQHLTLRDEYASPLLDMFDFAHSPSLDATIPGAPPPQPNDPGCPFSAS
jgi:phospholipase C